MTLIIGRAGQVGRWWEGRLALPEGLPCGSAVCVYLNIPEIFTAVLRPAASSQQAPQRLTSFPGHITFVGGAAIQTQSQLASQPMQLGCLPLHILDPRLIILGVI